MERKTKKLTTAQLNKKVWQECKRIIRTKYGTTCYTCQRHCEGSNQHTGHMIAKGSLPLKYKYDLNLLRIQCYFCNVNCGGQGACFVKNWEQESKKNDFEKLYKDIKQTKPMGSIEAWMFLTNLLEEYKGL